MIVRKVAAAAVVTMAVGLPLGAAHADADADAVPDVPVTSSLEESSDDAGGAAVWVGVVTGVSGVAGLAFAMRRPRVA